MQSLYGIFGTGGFAREVMPVARRMLQSMGALTNAEIVFVSKDAPSNPSLNGYRVLNPDAFYGAEASRKYFNVCIGDPARRESVSAEIAEKGIFPFSIVSDQSCIMEHNRIAEGAIFCPFSTVTSNARIGRFFHCNIYSYVAHDCVIEDFVTFAPGAKCNGNVKVQRGAYIGTGAIIKQGTPETPIVIGERAILGMGAVVTKSVPAFTTVVGNPAAPIKMAIQDA